MRKIVIYEPAMCCPTGICGPSVDPELLRISTVINNLKSNGIQIERHNLAGDPQAFVDNREINELLNEKGVEILPVTTVNGRIVKSKAYPTNTEFSRLLGVPEIYLKGAVTKAANGCSTDCG